MRLSLVLCDFAEVENGKLFVLGGGWNVKGAPNTPMALAMVIEVPWNEANRPHAWRVRLEGPDGETFQVPGPLGPQPLEITSPFEVGRPPGLIEGSEINVCVAFNLGPLPLPPRQRFTWSALIDENPDWSAHVSFMTAPMPPGLMIAGQPPPPADS